MPDEIENTAALTKVASVERRHFSWISVQNFLQIALILVGGGMAWSNLKDSINFAAKQQGEDHLRIDSVAHDLNDVAASQKTNATILANQQVEIAALQANRDTNQSLLMQMNGKIEVLLDRTDPNKHGRTP